MSHLSLPFLPFSLRSLYFFFTCLSVPTFTCSGGFFILSTPNRNILSYLAVIVAAERILGWIPVGMHRWVQFLKPEELEQHLRRAELVPTMRKGFVFDPLRWRWFITGCDWIDYIVVCQRSGSWLEG